MLPKAQRVAVLGLATDPFSGAFAERIRQDAQTVRFDTRPIMVRGAEELDDAFATMKKERTDAVIVLVNAPPPTVASGAEQSYSSFLSSEVHGKGRGGGLLQCGFRRAG